jgi:hypothetical protein
MGTPATYYRPIDTILPFKNFLHFFDFVAMLSNTYKGVKQLKRRYDINLAYFHNCFYLFNAFALSGQTKCQTSR